MRRLLLLAVALLFSSCAMGPDYVRPTVEVPHEYRKDISIPLEDSIVTDTFTVPTIEGDLLTTTPSVALVALERDSIPLISWWEIFNDPTIDSLVHAALEKNKDLLTAFARLDEAAAYAGVVRADLFPNISIQAGVSRGNSSGTNRANSTSNNFYAVPVLNWEIDVWGKLRRSNEAAKAQLLSTTYGVRTIQIALVTEVVKTYFELLSAKAQLATSEKTINTRKEDIRIMQARFDFGTVSALDLLQSQIQYEISIGQMMSSTRKYHIAEGKLNILLGNPPGAFKCNSNELYRLKAPQIPVGLPSELLERRPDILEAEYVLKRQNAQIGVAIAKRFPSISLTGLLGFASNDVSTFVSGGPAWSMAANLLGPLFNFRQTARAVDVERAKTEQALHTYEQSVLTAFHDVENALITVKTYNLEAQSSQRKVLFARSADSLSAARYKQGVTSYLEVLETQRTLLDVELEQARLTESYLASFLFLYKALGGGWVTEQEKEIAGLSEDERIESDDELSREDQALAREIKKAKKYKNSPSEEESSKDTK